MGLCLLENEVLLFENIVYQIKLQDRALEDALGVDIEKIGKPALPAATKLNCKLGVQDGQVEETPWSGGRILKAMLSDVRLSTGGEEEMVTSMKTRRAVTSANQSWQTWLSGEKCTNCSGVHRKGDCWANDVVCSNCNKKQHLRKCCQAKRKAAATMMTATAHANLDCKLGVQNGQEVEPLAKELN
jgi:hypothetical protein